MGVEQLKDSIKALSQIEKLELLQFITSDLLKDERLTHFERGQTHTVVGPFDEPLAAGQLMDLLAREG